MSFISAPAQAVVPAAPTCAEGGVCQIGDIGPGGGRVFYIAPTTFTQEGATTGMCTTNCKYLEAAPTSGTNAWTDNSYVWSDVTNTSIGTKGTAIGTGFNNTVAMVTQSATSSRAGSITRAYRGPNNLTDWYLASKDELNQMCRWQRGQSVSNDRCDGGTVNSGPGAAGFKDGWANYYYWSSSEDSAGNDATWAQVYTRQNPPLLGNPLLERGQQGIALKSQSAYVRPIRAFAPATKVAVTRASVGTARRTAFTTQPQITIQYANSDTATVSTAQVTATISTGGTLVGTTTATASAGTATFSGLGVDGTVGSTYTITYTVENLTVATESITLTGTTCNGATFICQVGDTGPGGGIVFYVAPTTFTQQGATGFMCSNECKYLEAAPTTGTNAWTDTFYRWSGNINTLIGSTGTAIGTGYKNTKAIVAQSSTNARAAKVSESFRGPNIMTDWFLPSKDELNQLCRWVRGNTVSDEPCYRGTNNSGPGAAGFVENYYWSSSEFSATNAWSQPFAGDPSSFYGKNDENLVRPIRAFGASPSTITIANVEITAPVRGSTPVSSLSSNGQYTTAITWSGSPTTFAAGETYTATVTVTPVTGYTLTGLGNNFFTVNGNSAINSVNTFNASTLGTTGRSPLGIAVDSLGNIYTANSDSDNVSKITPQGVSTILGSTDARPIAVAVDGEGNVYATNTGGTITKITPSGVSTLFGTVAPSPIGIAIDSLGNVYTANGTGQIVQKTTPLGVSSTFGTTGASPQALAIDSLGNVYISNSGGTVTKITPLGVSSTLGTTGTTPIGIAVDALGNVYTANAGADNVSKITPAGVSTILGTAGPIPMWIAVDSSGNVYTTSSTTDKIYKLTGQGISSIIGSVGLLPEGITVDSLGNVYTSDSVNRVVKFAATNSGVFTYQFPATAENEPTPTPSPSTTPERTAPPPSFLKSKTPPTIYLAASIYTCDVGLLSFWRYGVTEEPAKLSYQKISLLRNGVEVASLETLLLTATFEMKSLWAGSMMSCQISAVQENTISTFSSLGADLYNELIDTKRIALKSSDAKYYADRDAAYEKKRVELSRITALRASDLKSATIPAQIKAANDKYRLTMNQATNLWRAELKSATSQRAESKTVAGIFFTASLEKHGLAVIQP